MAMLVINKKKEGCSPSHSVSPRLLVIVQQPEHVGCDERGSEQETAMAVADVAKDFRATHLADNLAFPPFGAGDILGVQGAWAHDAHSCSRHIVLAFSPVAGVFILVGD